jgi:hypothetical protein
LSQALGSGFKHDEKLRDKRWEIFCELFNEDTQSYAKFHSIVLFHSPSNYEIEYLRVDQTSPFHKKYTIIDGRREAKEWIDELDEKKIDKRVHPRYREDEKVKY